MKTWEGGIEGSSRRGHISGSRGRERKWPGFMKDVYG